MAVRREAMDAEFAPVVFRSIAAALKDGWIDETFEPGTWAHRYYSAVRMFADDYPREWRSYLNVAASGDVKGRSGKVVLEKLRHYLQAFGIDLYPFDGES